MTPRTTFLSVLILTSLVALAQTPIFGGREAVEALTPTAAVEAWCPIVVRRVLDVDTVVGDVYLPWDVCLVGQHLRVDNWDGWESSKRRNSEASGGEIKDEEVAKGKRCTGELVAYLNDWQLQVKPGIRSRDNYGRLLGPWRFVNGSRVQDAKEVAIRKGWIRQ